jgi:uncharacterized protein (TIGR02271 family)
MSQSENKQENMTSPDKKGNKTNTVIFPVIEEELEIKKKVVDSGRLLITKKVEDKEFNIEIPTTEEEFEVRRIPVNKIVNGKTPQMRKEGDTMIIPVLKEVIVKKTMVTEEILITKRKTTTTSKEKIALRKEKITLKHEQFGLDENS